MYTNITSNVTVVTTPAITRASDQVTRGRHWTGQTRCRLCLGPRALTVRRHSPARSGMHIASGFNRVAEVGCRRAGCGIVPTPWRYFAVVSGLVTGRIGSSRHPRLRAGPSGQKGILSLYPREPRARWADSERSVACGGARRFAAGRVPATSRRTQPGCC